MRTPEEFMKTILDFARKNENIRMVGMEGSRVNSNIPEDSFQDYDITDCVRDREVFIRDDKWLSAFGRIIMMQKPEDMELFPAEEEGYSYLILFDDYTKMDLTLLELDQLEGYLKEDGLRTVLLDKDSRLEREIIPTDQEYHIKKPSARSFDDCCNEFWNLALYVAKGLGRKEILYAIDHLHLMRMELLRLLSWKAGLDYGFTFSVGKNYKFLDKYLPETLWKELLHTYREDSYDHVWEAMFLCHELFRNTACECAGAWGYEYPPYDKNVSGFVRHCYEKFG